MKLSIKNISETKKVDRPKEKGKENGSQISQPPKLSVM